jgi:hypothetical protein
VMAKRSTGRADSKRHRMACLVFSRYKPVWLADVSTSTTHWTGDTDGAGVVDLMPTAVIGGVSAVAGAEAVKVTCTESVAAAELIVAAATHPNRAASTGRRAACIGNTPEKAMGRQLRQPASIFRPLPAANVVLAGF